MKMSISLEKSQLIMVSLENKRAPFYMQVKSSPSRERVYMMLVKNFPGSGSGYVNLYLFFKMLEWLFFGVPFNMIVSSIHFQNLM